MKTCPNCLCSEKGIFFYQCGQCGTIYRGVRSDFEMGSTACPACGQRGDEVSSKDGADGRKLKDQRGGNLLVQKIAGRLGWRGRSQTAAWHLPGSHKSRRAWAEVSFTQI